MILPWFLKRKKFCHTNYLSYNLKEDCYTPALQLVSRRVQKTKSLMLQIKHNGARKEWNVIECLDKENEKRRNLRKKNVKGLGKHDKRR